MRDPSVGWNPDDLRVVSITFGTVDEYDVFTVLETILPSEIHDWLRVVVALPAGESTVRWSINWHWEYWESLLYEYRLLISDVYEETDWSEGEAAIMTFTLHTPAYGWQLRPEQYPTAQIIYTCTLTGDNESPPVTDLELPVTSFQSRRRSGDPSYLSVFCPFDDAYIDGIEERLNGAIIVKKGYKLQDGTYQMETIAESDFESFASYEGANNASISLTGYRTTTYSTPKSVTLDGVSYFTRQHDGKRRARCDVNLFIDPGDTADYGSGEMTAGDVVMIVTDKIAYMEVCEL